jgi:hypothetical protein
VNPGEDVTFSTAMIGGLQTYQWRFNGSPIGNATNASLTLTNVALAADGNYSVVVNATTNSGATLFFASGTFGANLHVNGAQPLALSSPQVLSNGSFRVVLQGNLNQTYALEISTNLTNWATLDTLVATNTMTPYIDNTATNAQRFYRARTQ